MNRTKLTIIKGTHELLPVFHFRICLGFAFDSLLDPDQIRVESVKCEGKRTFLNT
jgi:hypothetical protein